MKWRGTHCQENKKSGVVGKAVEWRGVKGNVVESRETI